MGQMRMMMRRKGRLLRFFSSGWQLDYNVRHLVFLDVLTMAIDAADELRWMSSI